MYNSEDNMDLMDWARGFGSFKLSDAQRAMMWGYNRTQAAISRLLEQGKLDQWLEDKWICYREKTTHPVQRDGGD